MKVKMKPVEFEAFKFNWLVNPVMDRELAAFTTGIRQQIMKHGDSLIVTSPTGGQNQCRQGDWLLKRDNAMYVVTREEFGEIFEEVRQQ